LQHARYQNEVIDLISQNLKISIIVLCHNTEKFLGKTIGYLGAHLRPDEELILVENGSVDNTYEALRQLISHGRYENIKIT
jgi:glycosyltransferase involved in cell wall biosynthesis